jgi:hypothetical protein
MSGRLALASLSASAARIATALAFVVGGCAAPRHPAESPCASSPRFAPWDEARDTAAPAAPATSAMATTPPVRATG